MRWLTLLGMALMAICTLAGMSAAAERTLTVFGASSLTEYLDAAKKIFEKAHPGVEVRLNIASSSQCRMQIEQGAPADVFMSADTTNMEPLVAAKSAIQPVVFAHNRLTVIIPKSNPGHVQALDDLGRKGLKLIIGAAEVPVGKYTRTVIDKMDASGKFGKDFGRRVLANVRSEEPAVKAVVTKVSLNEADAGICYISDVTPAVRGKLTAIRIPDQLNVVADYSIAVLKDSTEKDLAGDFVSYVLSKEGQKLLVQNGFLPLARPNRAK